MVRTRAKRLAQRSSYAFLGLTVSLALGCVAQDALEAARDAVARFNQERSAFEKLVAEGLQTEAQQETAQQHEIAAGQHMRNARDAFHAAGLPQRGELPLLREYLDVLRATGDHDLAAEALERAITLAPQDGLLRVELGESLARIGPERYSKAFAILRSALDYELTAAYAARAWFQIGHIYLEEGLHLFAREAFGKVLDFQPSAVRTQIALATLDAREGKVAEASATLDTLGRDAVPHDIETRRLLRGALADFDAARRYFDDTAENHRAYAKLLYRAARVQEAVGAAERAVRLAPEDYGTLNFIGAIHMQLGNARGARDAYRRSLSINPEQPNVRQSLATIPPEELPTIPQQAPLGVPFKVPTPEDAPEPESTPPTPAP